MRRVLAIAVLLTTAIATPAGAAKAPRFFAGAGKADITPPQTGYVLAGYTRADSTGNGQTTRLYANALVLQRGGKKIALVAVGLAFVTAGMTEDIAKELADIGITRENLVISATHTHSGPGGWTNNPTYNTAAPSVNTITDPSSFVELFNPQPADRQLYTFLVHQIAQSVRRANADRAPAAAGWGHAELLGLTQNRSLEAHLANYGIQKNLGEGKESDAPGGYPSTVDSNVEVLRVDKIRGKRHIPIGAWSTFANHGTVVKAFINAYSADHHGSAWQVFAQLVRKAGKVPARQTVVNVYGNADEGDMTSGFAHTGQAGADAVGRAEAAKMFEAWKRAKLTRTPRLDTRWTVACFCGRDTATGKVAADGHAGAPFFTGSEEGRGPLYDLTHIPFEGLMRSPVDDPEQGNKVVVPAGGFPPAVPISLVRIGDGAIAATPTESTKQVGSQLRAAVLDRLRPAGIKRVAIAGLANEYIQYVVTPKEYPWQSYEGGSTLFGPNEATFLQERTLELADGLVKGTAAPAPAQIDASYGVHPDGARYPDGATSGTLGDQPSGTIARLEHARMTWKGAPLGHDRPVDAPFVRVQRLNGTRWRTVDSDLGLAMEWHADADGNYDARWEIPLTAPAGTYRLVVSAQHYRLDTRPFTVAATTALTVERVDGGVRLRYPAAEPTDLTARPDAASGGSVTYSAGGRTRTVKRRTGEVFAVPAGATIAAGAARDRWGNANAAAAATS